jgi:general nucleoside transport system ATP-binding protein
LLDQREGSSTDQSQKDDDKFSTKRFIRRSLLDQRCEGSAILLISEDLDEIRALSDRIAVMYEGKIVGIVNRDEATLEELGLMMAGAHEKNAQAQLT